MSNTDIQNFVKQHNIGNDQIMAVIKCFSPCMNDYLYVYDIDEDIYSISESATKRFRVPDSVFSDVVEAHNLFVHPEDLAMLQADLNEMIEGKKESHNLRYRWLGLDGTPIWINCRGIIIRAEHTLMIGCINEIGEKSYADNVTGLLKTDAFRSELKKLVEPNGFLLRIGVDNFKQINERLGNDYGDKCLRELAQCIMEKINEHQKAFRMISDEILIADFSGGTESDAIRLYKAIRRRTDELFRENNYEAMYTISGGIMTQESIDIPKEEITYDWVNNRSIFTLNRAKELGKNQVYAFKKEDYEQSIRNGIIISSIRKAISEGCKGFSLNYQPIMRGGNRASIFGVESLLRLTLENGERLSPAEFIPLLEESGLIIPVGNWIFNEAFRICKLAQDFIPDFMITINLSYVQFRKSNLFEHIMSSLKNNNLSAESVVLEITESGYLEYASVQEVIQKLRAVGFKIAIDDFGTGYSNLHNIVELHPDIVKIDRSFTIKALHNEYEAMLMNYIISMVHSIDSKIVVEGIETREELTQINQLKPDFIQGFYYSKPLNEDDFIMKYV